MSDSVITVENLSKAYLLGRQDKSDTFFGSIASSIKSPLKNLRQLRRLNTFDLNQVDEGDEDILWALRDVSFEVKQGEVLGIIGHNGAGKSTLLKILSRIAYLTHGRVEMRGRVSALLEVGTGFHPELTGRENIYMNGTILGMRKTEIDSKFDEIVDFSGVERFLDTPVKRYSSGMKVRLAFAVAAHLEPEILIVDEVLAVGDAEFQKKCLGKMKDVSTGKGRTVLFVSHNLSAMQNLCDRVVLLSGGSVLFDGDPDSVIYQYTHSAKVAGDYGYWDLAAVPREAGLCPVIKELELTDNHGKITNAYLPGHSMRFRISYAHITNLINPTFGIIISTSLGQHLALLQTRLQLGDIRELPAKGHVECFIPELPLTSGTYTLTLGVSSEGHQLDQCTDVADFEVQEAKYFSTGKLPTQSQGSVLVKAEWSCHD